MARIDLDGDSVIVRLSRLEKLGALSGDVRVSRRRIQSVRLVESPLSQIRGLRVPGTAIPFVIALGTWRGRFGKDFVAATRAPGIVIELDGTDYARLVVSTPDAERIASVLG